MIDLRSVTPRGASRLVLHSIGDRTGHVASPIAFAPVRGSDVATFALLLEEAMRNELMESEADRHDTVGDAERERLGLPNRLLTAFDVARCLGCHEETVRRAYWRGLLRSQRFGVRGRRFHPHDVLDWLRRGAPTKNP